MQDQDKNDQHKSPANIGFLSSLAKFGPTLFVLAVMAGGWFVVHEINVSGQREEEAESIAEAALPDTLTLPAGKLAAAKFKSVPARVQQVNHVHTIPGRLRYDETKHIEVKTPMDGILTEVLVNPGEKVAAGQLLAVVRSPEIGQARAQILKHQQEREIAEQVFRREATLAENLSEMISMLDDGLSIESIETNFRDRSLGLYRQSVLAAFAKLQLATELHNKVLPLADSGSVAGRTIRERQANRQMAEADFHTARDQATFAANQAKLRAEANLAAADRQLNLAWQAIETLLGYQPERTLSELTSQETLSRLEVRAPFAGSVESRKFASNERVQRNDSLLTLANTDSLYVAASIRDSDWAAVSLKSGTAISVSVPALNDRTFTAQIRYVGREVQAETNSVPLVATLENSEGLLRPGMFVRVTIPIGEARAALSVRSEAVVQHENKSFVFLDESAGQYKRVDVSTGQVSDDWVEITAGLQSGQLVVTNGAFLLKSELLLQGESE
ncbi:efflux RND transporter periplasmic adaptor subunit [Planctomycetaceae bacterium SH139]